MRLVLDTNIVVSALLWPGKPTKLIELATDGVVQLFASKSLIDELSDEKLGSGLNTVRLT